MSENQLKKEKINKCNIYIALFMLYNLQGVLYASGSTISKLLLLAILLMSIYHTILLNANYYVPQFFKGLNYLLVLFTIYGIVEYLFGETIIIQENLAEVPKTEYLKNIYMSLLPINSFYYYSLKGRLTNINLKYWVFVFLVVATIGYYRYESELIASYSEKGIHLEEVTNNYGYAFLAMIPLVTLFRNKPIVQYPILLYCNTFIILSMKRGAMILGIITIFVFVYQNYKNAKRWHTKFAILAAGFSIVIGLFFAYDYMLEYSAFFSNRMEATQEGDLSYRDETYSFFFNHYIHDTNIMQFLFGLGANATIKIGFNYAHNDWLEILTNQGAIGLFVYMYYWTCFYNTWRNNLNKEINLAICLLFIIYLFRSFVSMSYSSMSIYATSMLGYCLYEMSTKMDLSKK